MRRSLVLSALAIAGVSTMVDAQLVTEGGRPVRARPAIVLPTGVIEPEPTMLRPMAVNIGRGEYRVVQVPIPAEIAATDSLRFVVRSAPGFRLLGRAEGFYAPGEHPRELTITVSANPGVLAGEQRAGEVEFHAGAVMLVVPLMATVPKEYGTTVLATPDRLGGTRGGRYAYTVLVTNSGNVTDTLVPASGLPLPWQHSTFAPSRVILEPAATARVVVSGAIPTTITPGGQSVTTRLMRGDSVASTVSAFLVVEEARAVARNADAPVLGITTGSVFVPNEPTLTAAALSLTGTVGYGTRIDARVNIVPDASAGVQRGASRLGLVAGLNYVRLTDKQWSIAAGPLSVPGNVLTGINANGQGAVGSLKVGAVSATAGVATPFASGNADAGGSLFGAVVDWQSTDSRAWTLGLSRLMDRSTARELSAASLSHEWSEGRQYLRAGVGMRQSAAGSGLALELGGRRETTDHGVELLYAHAPGGAAAFGRATDDVQLFATLSRRSRMPWSGSAFYQRDRSALVADAHSMGANFGPRIRLPRNFNLTSGLRANQFLRGGTIATSGTRDLSSYATISRSFGAYFTSVGASAGVVTQLLRPVGGASADVSATRQGMQAMVNASLPFATLGAQLQVDRNGGGIGLARGVRTMSVRAADVPLWKFGRFATVHGELLTTSQLGVQSAITSGVVGVNLRLGSSLAMVLESERVPFNPSGVGGPTWVTTLRVSSDVRVPSLTLTARSRGGSVYRDANANGQRDPGETGFAGVVLNDGMATAVTDAAGRFGFPSARESAPRIDERSLPFGWVVGRTTVGESGVEIAIIPTGTLRARVRFAPDTVGRTVQIPLDRVVVVAIDARKREWRAVLDDQGIASFDALPPGDYLIRAELIAVNEVMDLTRASSTARVDAGVEIPAVELVIRPRPVRIWIPPGRQGQGGQTDPGRSGTSGTSGRSTGVSRDSVPPTVPPFTQDVTP